MYKYKTLKPEVISHYKETGHTPAQMSRIFKIPRKTIHDWISEIKNEDVDKIIEDNKKYIKNEPFGTYRHGQNIESDLGLKRGGHLDLKLNSKGITKTVILSDLHMPYNIELKPVFDFISDFKPDHVILNGDVADLDCFSPHEMRSTLRPLPFSDQKNLCMELINDLKRLYNSNITWIQGNHEDWSRQAVLRNPALEGLVEQHHWLPEHVNFIPLNHCAKLGKLRIIHGNCLRNESIVMPSRTILERWSDANIIFGHFHKREAYTKISEINSEKRFAECSGCLCKVNPSYSRNSPSAVANGFCYVVSEPSGHYWSTLPMIHHGKFIAEGKVYE